MRNPENQGDRLDRLQEQKIKEDIILFNLFSVDGQDGHPSLANCSKYGKKHSKTVQPEDQRPRDPRPEDQRPRDPRPEDQRPEGG